MIESLSVHFIRPWWLLAIPVAILLPIAWRYLRRPSGDWARVCDPHLLRWLSVGEHAQRSPRAGSWLAGMVLAVAAIALSGPSGQRLPDSSYTSRDARVLVLDLSMSMLAEDLRPNRLTQARYRLSDMLEETVEGQMGLVAYAGDAYVVSPLTSDMNTIANMLPSLQPGIIPVAGSRADRALVLAAELLQRAGIKRGEILLISDDANAADVETAARLAGSGIVTSVLGVGTPQGAPIPSGNGFVTDANGNVIIARLGFEGLRAVAKAGGGKLTALEMMNSQKPPWREDDDSEFALRDDALGERWKDAGPWLVLLLLPLVALGFRRGLLFTLPLLMLPGLLLSQPARAGAWDDLWQRRDQQAQSALARDRPGEAAALARDPEISGEAWYRSGDYQSAMAAWSQSDFANAHYNRGNALANADDYDAAITAYDAALLRNPEMEDALYNRALLEQMKKQQEQQNQESAENPSGEDLPEAGEQRDSEEQGTEGEGAQNESEEDSNESGLESQPSKTDLEQTWSEEDAQAMEQWLRRIPDDPGGLLRRKFRNQHQRRGAPEDEKKTW